MKRTLLAFLFGIFALSAMSQVQFSKFKFIKDEPFGAFRGRKAIGCKFKNTSDKPLKYVKVWYYAVNAVDDVISGKDRGFIFKGKEYIKPKRLDMTGPFEVKKSYSRWASGVITATDKNTRAVPFAVTIVYMGSDEEIEIQITEDNIKEIFPTVPWVDYNRWNNEL